MVAFVSVGPCDSRPFGDYFVSTVLLGSMNRRTFFVVIIIIFRDWVAIMIVTKVTVLITPFDPYKFIGKIVIGDQIKRKPCKVLLVDVFFFILISPCTN